MLLNKRMERERERERGKKELLLPTKNGKTNIVVVVVVLWVVAYFILHTR